MATKKSIIDNELVREIISIRLDTLWRMLSQVNSGFLPGVTDEGASGKFDNKGAIFIPGGLIYQDVDEKFIRYMEHGKITGAEFREKIRRAMRYDNATLLYPEGIAEGINLDGGFFSRAARKIYTYKRAAYRRVMKLGNNKPVEISTDDIIRSHCPVYMRPPYGARTRISTCIAVGLINPPLFYAYYKTELNFSSKQSGRFIQDLDQVRDQPISGDGKVLYPPFIVVCHDTRYKENSYTGLTRILGIGKFGEFATLSFEVLNNQLLAELKRRKIRLREEDVIAEFGEMQFLCLLRVYAPTNPGKRSTKYTLHILSPTEDLDLNVKKIEKDARRRYKVKKIRKSPDTASRT